MRTQRWSGVVHPRPRPIALMGAALLLSAGRCWPQDDAVVAAPPVELQVPGGWLSLFPSAGKPAVLHVLLRKNVPEKTSLRCRVIVDALDPQRPAGYEVSAPVALELGEPGRWYEATFSFVPLDGAPQMVTGKVIVRGTAGRVPVRFDVPIRLGWGALAFLERRSLLADGDPQSVEVTCLENPLLRAEFIPQAGCLSGLFSHLLGGDLLVPGDAPMGLVWAGPGDWYQTVQSPPGPAPGLEFVARCHGAPVALQAELAEASDTLRVRLDAGEATVPPGPVYLMLTRSQQGQDLLRLPFQGGEEDLQPQADAQHQVLRQGDSVKVLYWNADWDETLEVTARGPGLGAVEWGMEAPWYNWVALQPSAAPWGCLEVELRLLPGRFP